MTAVKYITNSKRHTYRLAVVVSKKISKSAVRRNRIRRRLYEVVRQLEDAISEPYDIVLTVFHEQIAELPAQDLKRLVYSQFKQAGIIKKKQS